MRSLLVLLAGIVSGVVLDILIGDRLDPPDGHGEEGALTR